MVPVLRIAVMDFVPRPREYRNLPSRGLIEARRTPRVRGLVLPGCVCERRIDADLIPVP
jgi:hypothetical protein